MAKIVQAQEAELRRVKRLSAGKKEKFAEVKAVPSWKDWKAYKPGLLVAAIVFVMLVYGVPRLKQWVPQLVTPTGRLGSVGLAVAALLTGAAYQGASKALLK